MTPTLIYDAHCSLCETTKNWLSRWGRHREVQFLHFEDPQACTLQPDLNGLEYLDAFRFIDKDGRSWKGAEAVIHAVKVLPFGKPIAWILSLPGMYRLAETAYTWVAQNRYWIFGRTR
jgi:predicted DCC family thiol-disulfide oxidoreductase YuxK